MTKTRTRTWAVRTVATGCVYLGDCGHIGLMFAIQTASDTEELYQARICSVREGIKELSSLDDEGLTFKTVGEAMQWVYEHREY